MKAAELAPEHLSAYSLIIEEGTPFWSWYGEDANQTLRPKEMLPLPSEEDERRMYARTREILEQYGYHRYEISNYAKEMCIRDSLRRKGTYRWRKLVYFFRLVMKK